MRMLTTLVLAGASVAAEAEPMTSHVVRSLNPVVQWNRTLLSILRTPGAQPATVHPTRSFVSRRSSQACVNSETTLPGVETAARHAQTATENIDGMLGLLRRDEGKPHRLCFAKKAAAFFRISAPPDVRPVLFFVRSARASIACLPSWTSYPPSGKCPRNRIKPILALLCELRVIRQAGNIGQTCQLVFCHRRGGTSAFVRTCLR